jgi:hypothetical protein
MENASQPQNQDRAIFVIDIVMMVLVLVNLSWLTFDWLFQLRSVQRFLEGALPQLYYWYRADVHGDFLKYDMIFVIIFLTEFLVRWVLAVVRNTYHNWFFYPFIHWYDVLGCIPVGTFRILRLFRVISITYRLQRMGVINVKEWYLSRQFRKYAAVVSEEISDRVVINILDGIQQEMTSGSPVSHQIGKEVLLPQQDAIVAWAMKKIRKTADTNYDSDHIQERIKTMVAAALDKNAIASIPLVGKSLTGMLEKSISGILFKVVDGIVRELTAQENNKVENMLNKAFEGMVNGEEDEEFNAITRNITIAALELIKQNVKVQQWKLREQAEREVMG